MILTAGLGFLAEVTPGGPSSAGIAVPAAAAATALRALAAALGGLVILWLGVRLLGLLAQPQPEPPPPGELRKVRITYRCSLCGTEVRMTVAPTEDPDPPRHCGEEMSIMAPIEE